MWGEESAGWEQSCATEQSVTRGIKTSHCCRTESLYAMNDE